MKLQHWNSTQSHSLNADITPPRKQQENLNLETVIAPRIKLPLTRGASANS